MVSLDSIRGPYAGKPRFATLATFADRRATMRSNAFAAVGLVLCSALFFTYVLNRSLVADGGHCGHGR